MISGTLALRFFTDQVDYPFLITTRSNSMTTQKFLVNLSANLRANLDLGICRNFYFNKRIQ